MTAENKKLLFKDLCSRLPYKVIVEIISYGQEDLRPWFGELSCKDLECFMLDVAYKSVKPYLRPMSSMTKDEKKEFNQFGCGILECSPQFEIEEFYKVIDWLNAHHFDYRNLIGKGLALEAPEYMYNTKKK